MQMYQMRDMIPENIVNNFITTLYSDREMWNYGVPGGFLTNHPKRFVNAFGNGQPIDNNGDIDESFAEQSSPECEAFSGYIPSSSKDSVFVGRSSGPECKAFSGWPATSWTAKINQNNVTLQTKTGEMPPSFCKIIPYFRSLFLRTFPDAQITDYTFNIAVCNYYTDPTMNIAAHTDDNVWYPRECPSNNTGPVFASLTLYPFSKPTHQDNYGRFQIHSNGKWIQVYLPHESILIMPSGIKHRVLPHIKRKQHLFLPRINITFRSTYPIYVNPLMNYMAVANHTRYYRVPFKLIFPEILNHSTILDIYHIYNNFLKSQIVDSEQIEIEYVNGDRSSTKKKYKELYNLLIQKHSFMNISKYSANMSIEALIQVCNFIGS